MKEKKTWTDRAYSLTKDIITNMRQSNLSLNVEPHINKMVITWNETLKEYIATTDDFPSCEGCGETPTDACDMLLQDIDCQLFE